VLQIALWPRRVKIASMELLRNRRNFLVRVRTSDGAEGIGVPNAMHLIHTHPIFLNRVAPFFVGKDVRQLEDLLWELYRHADNYVCSRSQRLMISRMYARSSGESSRPMGIACHFSMQPRQQVAVAC